MSVVDTAIATQLKNIEKRSGKSLDELAQIVKASGLNKHGEIRDMLKRELGLGHGDANTLVHHVLKSDGASVAAEKGQTPDDVTAELYAGPKAALRPIHDAVMAAIGGFGEFEIAPKKTYLSLRRKKQFAMVGPATKTQVEVGLNAKGLAKGLSGGERLQELPPKGMCDYKVRISDLAEVDAELIAWIRAAYDSAG